MNILFITPNNLATNPRILKEIKLAISEGYKVGVVIFKFSGWSDSFNNEIIKDLKGKLNIYIISAGRKPFHSWLISTLLNLVAGKLMVFLPKNKFLLSVHIEKRSFLLFNFLKNFKVNPDLVIAHNIGAFYPSYSFSKERKIPFAIDIEDYHAGEKSNLKKEKNVTQLCNEIFPQATYLSAASPLILEYSLKDIGNLTKQSFVVNNFFLSSDFIEPASSSEGIMKMVWFSQNINEGRGLEYLITTVKSLKSKLELHLYGNLNQDFYNRILKGADNIIIHSPLSQSLLHKELSRYDIGLAIEPDKDLNNSIAVSNKINAYRQAGLYVLASDTLAQVKWMKEHPAFGINFHLNNDKEVYKVLSCCFEQIKDIRKNAKNRFEDAKIYCWEKESEKLSEVWRNIIDNRVNSTTFSHALQKL